MSRFFFRSAMDKREKHARARVKVAYRAISYHGAGTIAIENQIGTLLACHILWGLNYEQSTFPLRVSRTRRTIGRVRVRVRCMRVCARVFACVCAKVVNRASRFHGIGDLRACSRVLLDRTISMRKEGFLKT